MNAPLPNPPVIPTSTTGDWMRDRLIEARGVLVDTTQHPESLVTLWQQLMRGALSQLPMASGPWIWRPTNQPQRPAQMDFLEGLQP